MFINLAAAPGRNARRKKNLIFGIKGVRDVKRKQRMISTRLFAGDIA